MLRLNQMHGFNVTSNRSWPVCNVGASVNSTLTSAVTGPYWSSSVGGVVATPTQLRGYSGQWDNSYANRTVTQWTVDLDTGVETLGASDNIPAAVYEPSGIVSYHGRADAPCFVFRHQHPIGAGIGVGVMLPGGATYSIIKGTQWTAGTIRRFHYKDSAIYISNASDSKVRKINISGAVLWVDATSWDTSPLIAASSDAIGSPQSMGADSSYLYCLMSSTASIYQLSAVNLATNAILTNPLGAGDRNVIMVDEYGILYASGASAIWRHDGSNSWTQISSSIGSCATSAGQDGASTQDVLTMSRRILYRLDINSVGGSYPLYKSISPC